MKSLDPRLLRYSRKSRGLIFLAVLIALVTAVLAIVIAWALSRVITERHLVTVLIIGFSLRAGLHIIDQKIATSFSIKIRSELRIALLHRTLQGQSEKVKEMGPASIALLLTRGITNLDKYFSKFIPQLFIAAILPLAVGTAISIVDWRSGLIILLTIPLIPFFGITIGRFTASATVKKMSTLSFLGTYFLDLLTGLPTLKVYGRSKSQKKKLAEIGEQYRVETMKVLRIAFLSSLALELVATLSVALLAIFIGLRVFRGEMSLQSGLFILILAPEVYWPIRQVSALFHSVSDGVAVSGQIFAILDEPIREGGRPVAKINSIQWSELTVGFPDRSVIVIPAGELLPGRVTALVGPSGVGKSTLISLLLGLRTPESGSIRVTTEHGIIDYKDLDLAILQSQLSWLPQTPHLSAGTIRDYVGDTNFLADVGLLESDIPDGFNAQVGSMSDQLSYGQMRKLALARALSKPSIVLLVDEPTASMDLDSEIAIAKTLELEALKGKIVLVATHRSSTISSAASEISLEVAQ